MWLGFLCSSMAFKTHLFQNIPSVHLFHCVWKLIITYKEKKLTFGISTTYFSLFEGQIKLVHLCLFVEIKLFGIKFILFNNRRHIIYVWSLACLIIGFNQSVAHGRICVHKRLDYSSLSPPPPRNVILHISNPNGGM